MSEEMLALQKRLTEELDNAAKLYYQDGDAMMTDREYDQKYDQLVGFETMTGKVFPNSPTHKVGYESLSSFPKTEHCSPMLSLNKTKNIEDLIKFLGDEVGILSWKLDGVSIILTYEAGHLVKAATRGDGKTGEDITENAKTFLGVPLELKEPDDCVIRGEALITYDQFQKLNASGQYSNPRNLCSGSVRLLNPEECAKRGIVFMAYSLVSSNVPFGKHISEWTYMAKQGFDLVPYVLTDASELYDKVELLSKEVKYGDIPCDGLVLLIDDIEAGARLGATARFPKNMIAFKWTDEKVKTKVIDVKWHTSDQGRITPVAVLEPVDLTGTTVSRANLYNLTRMDELGIGIGSDVLVYKANMMVPQIAEVLTPGEHIEIPVVCPRCGGEVRTEEKHGIVTLWCENCTRR